MLLKSIEIQGFKSFADKTTLKFGAGITGIVGPNGSGKSNISDAVRWVLGEQSNKNLRGQNMEDVIFSGTADRPPHGYAEVTLVIDNTDRTLQFDGDTVAVTRRAYRSHESEYLINKASVRLKDIHELFMDTGLGRDGYSMIGQGKIDGIVSSKSDERRDIFEEAAGISRYRYRKAEAERKLELSEQNLLRLNDILSELSSRLEPLKEESRKAEEFLRLSEEKKRLEVGLWLNTIARFGDTLHSEEAKIALSEERYAAVGEELKEISARIDERANRFADLTAKIDGCVSRAAALKEETARVGGDIAVLDTRLSHVAESEAAARGDLETLRRSAEGAEAQIAECRAAVEEKSAAVERLRERTASLAAESASAADSDGELLAKIASLTAHISELDDEAARHRLAAATASAAAGETDGRAAALAGELETVAAEREKLLAERAALQDDLVAAKRTLSERENALRGYEMLYRSKEQKAGECREKADKLSLDIEAKKRRIAILDDMQKNLEGFQNSVKSVMRAAAAGSLGGVIGTVSQVLGVPEEYTVAVETALGGAAQDIVTDTDTDAKRAMAYLKRGNLGRATFLPVNSVKPRTVPASGYSGCRGYVGIASDLVTFEPRYRNVAEFLLGGTVVAEDIDAATAMARQNGYRAKIVTLDGQVVNPGGSLTGGSVQRGAGFFSRAADLGKLKAELEELSAKLPAAREALDAALAEQTECAGKITAARAALSEANGDKIRVEGEQGRVDGLVRALKSREDALSEERTRAGERLARLSGERQRAETAASEAESAVGELRGELDAATLGREDNARKREELSSRMADLRVKVAEAEKDLQSELLRGKLLEESAAGRGEREAELVSRLESLRGEAAAHTAERERLVAKSGELSAAGERCREEAARLTAERDGYDSLSKELRDREREAVAERERVGAELERLRERRENTVREYDETVARLYDEYGMTRSEAENFTERAANVGEATRALNRAKNAIRSLGNVNVSAVEEYKIVSERYEFLSAQLRDVETSRTELRKIIYDLTDKMKARFTEGFNQINSVFSGTFRDLFGGGKASLVLTDPDNVLESGIDIVAKLPGKNVPSLDGLSGGEKALVAIAIYFSIMKVNPPPFCFLDEVDTALDDINVERFAEYMKSSGLPTQFICVTHRRGTMEAADMLYGVTMQEKGVTKLLELNVDELARTMNLA